MFQGDYLKKIWNKNIYYKNRDNYIKHIIMIMKNSKKERNILLNEIYEINNTKSNELIKANIVLLKQKIKMIIMEKR